MTKLFLIRHCQSVINTNNIIAGHSNTDSPLTETGLEQARMLALRIAKEVGRPDHIYCSPATRARQTADFIVKKLDIPISFHHELLERNYGDIEGLSFDEFKKNMPDDWAEFERTRNVSSGESIQDVFDRANAIVQTAFRDDDHSNIAIITHLGVIRALMSVKEGTKPTAWPSAVYPHGSICTVTTNDTD